MTKSQPPKAVRDLLPEDWLQLEEQLAPFRAEFACWQDMFSHDWEILDFARYENVTSAPQVRRVLERTEGLVLGEKCVALYGCEWCMIEVGGQWHFAIRHGTLPEPIDVSHLNRKHLERRLPKAWRRRIFRPPGPRK